MDRKEWLCNVKILLYFLAILQCFHQIFQIRVQLKTFSHPPKVFDCAVPVHHFQVPSKTCFHPRAHQWMPLITDLVAIQCFFFFFFFCHSKVYGPIDQNIPRKSLQAFKIVKQHKIKRRDVFNTPNATS